MTCCHDAIVYNNYDLCDEAKTTLKKKTQFYDVLYVKALLSIVNCQLDMLQLISPDIYNDAMN